MGEYLEKFRDTLGPRQGQQVLRLLNKRRNSGQIRTIEEFSTQLQDLIRELTETTLKPTLSLFEPEENKVIDSESYNFMLERVQDDLEAAFEESNNIDEVQISHNAIIKDVLLKNLRAGVSELQSKVDLYEFLNKSGQGFDDGLFTTFRETKENRTERGDQFSSILFNDPRRLTLMTTSEDAAVDLLGERLTLGYTNKTNHQIKTIRQIFDNTAPQSELIVVPPGTKLINIIDDTKGTYWVQSLLFNQARDSVRTKLELDLGIVREINYLDIEPAIRYSVVLEDISYLDSSGSIVSLGLDEVKISAPGSLQFRKLSARKIILTFRNENPNRIEFEYNPNKVTLYNQAISQPPEGIQPILGDIAEELNTLMSSGNIKDIIGVSTDSPFLFAGYEFLIGFDNIRLGLADHQPRSIYVSSPILMSSSGEIGLRTLESRPFTPVPTGDVAYTTETYDNLDNNEASGSNSRNFLSSIEYWIIKQNLNQNGALLKTNVFPILPIGTERIHHERLVLNEKSEQSLVTNNIGTLIFFTNVADGDIKVYRNFQLLSNVTGDAGATDGWKTEPEAGSPALRTPGSGERMRFKIKILNPLPTDIYTVTYTPLKSTTKAIPTSITEFTTVGGLQIVDLVGDLSIRVDSNQVVLVDNLAEETTIAESKIYLVIILRQNTADTSLSSAVEEYTLLIGNKDPSKFLGFEENE